MSLENIITEIQKRPEIWLSSHRNFKNRFMKAKVWKELATNLGIEEDTLKKRWKHLKDHFRKELKKHPVLRSGEESDYWQSSWQYYNSMLFMKDEIIELQDTEQHASEIQDIEAQDTEMQVFTIMPEISALSPAPSFPASSSPSQSQVSKKRATVRDDILEIEKKKLKLMERRLADNRDADNLNNDEDFLFLKSLLSSMKKLNAIQKLRFRGNVNNLLLEAIAENEHNY